MECIIKKLKIPPNNKYKYLVITVYDEKEINIGVTFNMLKYLKVLKLFVNQKISVVENIKNNKKQYIITKVFY